MFTIVFGVIFNTHDGFIGYLPVISTLLFLFFINIKDMVKFKAISALVMFLWLIYDLEIHLYTTAFFDLVTTLSCLVVMYSLAHEKPDIVKRKSKKVKKSKSK